MNTVNSEKVRERFRRREPASIRRTVQYSHIVDGAREDVFPLICPAREADWLPGWDAHLIYSESELGEAGCVFRTEEDGRTGAGLWVFPHHVWPECVKIVRFSPPVLVQINIVLEELEARRTRISWEYSLTGLSDEGNGKVREVGDSMYRLRAGHVPK